MRLPMFPLNTVLFPGVRVPLRVFEDRYRAMVRHLLSLDSADKRAFASVGIREGYEVGDHGAQSLYRVGCRLQLTEADQQADGTYEIEAVGMGRIQLDRLDASGDFPVGEVRERPEPEAHVPDEVVEGATATFTAYRQAIAPYRPDPYEGSLPKDPTMLSWVLAASAPLPMPDRQSLLEADNPAERLVLVAELLRSELQAMNVIASLPATEIARTRWSPN